ncbi:MAG: hypothetical protein WCY12_06365, partial [Candidatus Omnitrophota bacterium]
SYVDLSAATSETPELIAFRNQLFNVTGSKDDPATTVKEWTYTNPHDFVANLAKAVELHNALTDGHITDWNILFAASQYVDLAHATEETPAVIAYRDELLKLVGDNDASDGWAYRDADTFIRYLHPAAMFNTALQGANAQQRAAFAVVNEVQISDPITDDYRFALFSLAADMIDGAYHYGEDLFKLVKGSPASDYNKYIHTYIDSLPQLAELLSEPNFSRLSEAFNNYYELAQHGFTPGTADFNDVIRVLIGDLAAKIGKTEMTAIDINTGAPITIHLNSPLAVNDYLISLQNQIELRNAALSIIQRIAQLEGVPFFGNEANSPILRQVIADFANSATAGLQEIVSAFGRYEIAPKYPDLESLVAVLTDLDILFTRYIEPDIALANLLRGDAQALTADRGMRSIDIEKWMNLISLVGMGTGKYFDNVEQLGLALAEHAVEVAGAVKDELGRTLDIANNPLDMRLLMLNLRSVAYPEVIGNEEVIAFYSGIFDAPFGFLSPEIRTSGYVRDRATHEVLARFRVTNAADNRVNVTYEYLTGATEANRWQATPYYTEDRVYEMFTGILLETRVNAGNGTLRTEYPKEAYSGRFDYGKAQIFATVATSSYYRVADHSRTYWSDGNGRETLVSEAVTTSRDNDHMSQTVKYYFGDKAFAAEQLSQTVKYYFGDKAFAAEQRVINLNSTFGTASRVNVLDPATLQPTGAYTVNTNIRGTIALVSAYSRGKNYSIITEVAVENGLPVFENGLLKATQMVREEGKPDRKYTVWMDMLHQGATVKEEDQASRAVTTYSDFFGQTARHSAYNVTVGKENYSRESEMVVDANGVPLTATIAGRQLIYNRTQDTRGNNGYYFIDPQLPRNNEVAKAYVSDALPQGVFELHYYADEQAKDGIIFEFDPNNADNLSPIGKLTRIAGANIPNNVTNNTDDHRIVIREYDNGRAVPIIVVDMNAKIDNEIGKVYDNDEGGFELHYFADSEATDGRVFAYDDQANTVGTQLGTLTRTSIVISGVTQAGDDHRLVIKHYTDGRTDDKQPAPIVIDARLTSDNEIAKAYEVKDLADNTVWEMHYYASLQAAQGRVFEFNIYTNTVGKEIAQLERQPFMESGNMLVIRRENDQFVSAIVINQPGDELGRAYFDKNTGKWELHYYPPRNAGQGDIYDFDTLKDIGDVSSSKAVLPGVTGENDRHNLVTRSYTDGRLEDHPADIIVDSTGAEIARAYPIKEGDRVVRWEMHYYADAQAPKGLVFVYDNIRHIVGERIGTLERKSAGLPILTVGDENYMLVIKKYDGEKEEKQPAPIVVDVNKTRDNEVGKAYEVADEAGNITWEMHYFADGLAQQGAVFAYNPATQMISLQIGAIIRTPMILPVGIAQPRKLYSLIQKSYNDGRIEPASVIDITVERNNLVARVYLFADPAQDRISVIQYAAGKEIGTDN